MQQRLPHGVKERGPPYYLYNSFRQSADNFGEDGPEPEILRPNCCLMIHFIRLDDIVVSVEHPKADLGGLPT